MAVQFSDIIENKQTLDFNDPEFKPLVDSARKGKLIVFYGAGVSMIGGCDGWQQLANRIIQGIMKIHKIGNYSYLDESELYKISSQDPIKALTICRNIFNNQGAIEKYHEILLEGVMPKFKDKFIEIHQSIIDLGAKILITTNYDDGINEKNFKGDIYDVTKMKDKDFDKVDLSNDSKKIFYLHGMKTDVKSVVLTADQYYQHYEGNRITVASRLLDKVFNQEGSVVVFIGYGLNEYQILRQLYKKSKVMGNDDRKHYFFSPIYSNQEHQLRLEREYFNLHNTIVVPYYLDQESYAELFDVLKILRGFIVDSDDYMKNAEEGSYE